VKTKSKHCKHSEEEIAEMVERTRRIFGEEFARGYEFTVRWASQDIMEKSVQEFHDNAPWRNGDDY
jgi:hypothetical protein